jgi:hypothetical protein
MCLYRHFRYKKIVFYLEQNTWRMFYLELDVMRACDARCNAVALHLDLRVEFRSFFTKKLPDPFLYYLVSKE